jgi:hypothetical protein
VSTLNIEIKNNLNQKYSMEVIDLCLKVSGQTKEFRKEIRRYIFIFIFIYVCINRIYIYIYMFIYMFMYTYSIYTYVCIYIYIDLYIYIHIYINFIFIHTNLNLYIYREFRESQINGLKGKIPDQIFIRILKARGVSYSYEFYCK